MLINSSTNVQVVQDLYAAFGRGDLPGMLATLDTDIEWLFVGRSGDVPFAGCHRGHEGMRAFFQTVAATCEVLEFGPHEVMAWGDRVLALGQERVRVRATGRTFAAEGIHLFTLAEGRIVAVRAYYDTASMAAAFRSAS